MGSAVLRDTEEILPRRRKRALLRCSAEQGQGTLPKRLEAAAEFLDLLRTQYRVSEQGLGFRMFEKGHVLPP